MPTPISDSDDARPMPVSDERRADGTWSEPVPSSPPAAGVAVAAAALATVAAAAAPAAASTVASRDVLLREMALNLRPPSDESRSSAPTPPSQSAKRLLARCSVAGPRRCARSAESCRARVAATASAYASLWERRTSPSLARLPLVCPSGRGQSVAGSAGALESSWPLRYVPPLGPQGTCHRWCRHRWHRHHRHQRRQALMACGDKRKLRRQAQVPSLAASSRWSRASLDLRLSRWSRASLAASSRWRPRVRRRAATLWHSRRRAQGRLSQQRAPSACLAFAYAFASASTRGQALRGSRGTACQRRGR